MNRLYTVFCDIPVIPVIPVFVCTAFFHILTLKMMNKFPKFLSCITYTHRLIECKISVKELSISAHGDNLTDTISLVLGDFFELCALETVLCLHYVYLYSAIAVLSCSVQRYDTMRHDKL